MRPVPLTGADRFTAAMNARPCARSPHFFLHHVAVGQLSTDLSPIKDEPVEDCCVPGVRHRLGMVVPKRHARRSVTRSLVKRQIREGVRRHVARLPVGDWVLRLRAPIDRSAFPSARSAALGQLLRDELDQLLIAAAERLARSARDSRRC